MNHACIDGRYVLEERMAEGGMGQVFRARHMQLGKMFALKVIAPAFAEDDVTRTRFNQEAQLASQISHPNIVSVVDFGEDIIVGAYMVMELVEGEPLIAPDGAPMTIRKVLEVLGQIADVLEHIHNAGIIHGDIKAENILLVTEVDGSRRRQVVRVLDFGLAQRMGEERRSVDGTPQYIAPERVSGGPPTIASDLYALGVLGYLMLTGRFPFDGTVIETLMAHVNDDAPPLAAVRGEPVDPAIQALIARAMAKDPADRPPTASAFRYEINAVMDMLAMTRRRRSSSMRAESKRGATISMLFEKSPLPQAVLSGAGEIDVANEAFAQLLGTEQQGLEGAPVDDTVLLSCVPGLMDKVRCVLAEGEPSEQRARVETGAGAAIDLVIWIAPFAAEAVHMLVRVERLQG